MFGEEELIKSHRKRVTVLANIILVSFAIILARLWYLQVYRGNILFEYSLKNRLRKEIVRAPRGMIFSRNNHLLVDNIPRFDAVLTPQYLTNKEETIKNLAKILDMPLPSVKKIIKKYNSMARYKSIVIKKNISRKEVALIETQNFSLPGVSVDTFISREYADSEVGAHLFGYISEISQEQLPKYRERDNINYNLGDFIGQSGLEEHFDLILRGRNGYDFVEVDALGRKRRHINTDNLFQGIKDRPSTPGENLRLTIDRDLQKTAFKALEGKNGSAVAVSVSSGEVLAMVSRPAFNPTNFSRGLTSEYWRSLVMNPQRPLRDRTIQEHYAPGSTFKAITAIAALEEGIVDEKTEVSCNGRFRLGRRTYHCWKRQGHGKVDLVGSLRESCDVYYYKIATKLDIDVLAKYSKAMGLGKRTGIDLSREESGLIPSKDWKLKRNGRQWQLGETLSCVIGQSYMLTTPLQLAMSYTMIANGGKLYKPFIVKEIFSNSGKIVEKRKPELKKEITISEKTLKLVRQGLFEVANSPNGTVWWRRGKGLQMSGKTGTSQVIRLSADKIYSKCADADYNNRHHGLFVGYAPSDNPEIVASAIIEHGCSGSKAAAPVVVSILDTYMEKYLPDVKKKNAEKEKKHFLAFLKRREEAKKKKEEEEQEALKEKEESANDA